MSKASQDREILVIALLKAGTLKREICVATGLSLPSIKRIQKKYGILVDPEVRRQHTSAASKAKWQSDEFKAKFTDSLAEIRQSAEYRQNMSDALKLKWLERGHIPKVKLVQPIKVVKLKETPEERLVRQTSPEYKLAHSIKQKEIWTNIELRKKHSNIMRGVWTAPEYKDTCIAVLKNRVFPDGYHSNMVQDQTKIKIEDSGSFASNFPDLLIEWSINNNISPTEITSGSTYRANWVCSKNPEHRWQATVRSRCYIGHPSGCPYCVHQCSKDEQYILEFVRQFCSDVQSRVRGLLENKALEIDVYIPSRKLGIEVCGQYWHGEQRIGSKSHYEKFVQAQAAGIRLLTVFDSELFNRTKAVEGYLLSILGEVRESKFARKCEIIELSQGVAGAFLDEYHMQGGIRAIYHYGLQCNNILVAVMSFTKKSDVVVDLSRFCVQNGVRVPGGASRLLSYFRKQHPEFTSIISFSDNRYSKGDLYEALGFKLVGEAKPSYWYFANGQRELLHKFGFRLDAIEAKLGPLLPDETEYQAMLRFGYDRIWDCGKKKWALSN
jgi:hypothetical protein